MIRIVEWTSTTFVLIAASLTAYNIYPANVAFQLVGNVGWLVVGLSWRRWSIVVINGALLVVYVIGTTSKLF